MIRNDYYFLDGGINWVETFIKDETVHLSIAKEIDSRKSIAGHINGSDSRFIIARLAKKNNDTEYVNFFIFCCPESTPARLKMIMSSSKASVIAAAMSQGIFIDK